MNTTKFIRTAKVGYIALSALLCLFGLLLIIFPDTAANVAGVICAILLIAFGIIKIIGYFSRDIYRLAFQYDLAFGLLMILLGAAMFANPGSLSSFICLSLGLYILTDSLFKIQIALDARSHFRRSGGYRRPAAGAAPHREHPGAGRHAGYLAAVRGAA